MTFLASAPSRCTLPYFAHKNVHPGFPSPHRDARPARSPRTGRRTASRRPGRRLTRSSTHPSRHPRFDPRWNWSCGSPTRLLPTAAQTVDELLESDRYLRGRTGPKSGSHAHRLRLRREERLRRFADVVAPRRGSERTSGTTRCSARSSRPTAPTRPTGDGLLRRLARAAGCARRSRRGSPALSGRSSAPSATTIRSTSGRRTTSTASPRSSPRLQQH